MSESSDKDVDLGKYLYGVGDEETKKWFVDSWKVWPKRIDKRLTTNGSLHYGGLLQYRLENDNVDPPMSESFRIHVKVMDGFREK